MSQVLFSSDTNSITYFPSGDACAETCVVFFSFWGERDLNSKISGTDPLVRAGLDVICIQTNCDDWHQGLSQGALDILKKFLDGRYKSVHGYGSSMGAFAAIAFSKLLNFDYVLALSPQYKIDQDFDTRWHRNARKIDWRYQIDPASTSDNCRYFLVYDPLNVDHIHIQKIVGEIGDDNCTQLKIKYASHPAIHWLYEVGILKDLMLNVFHEGQFPAFDYRAIRKISSTHYGQVAKRLAQKGKTQWAIDFLEKAVSLALNDKIKCHHLLKLGDLYRATGNFKRSIEILDQALAIIPLNADALASKSQTLAQTRQHQMAIATLEQALAITGPRSDFYRQLSTLHHESGDLDSAITTAKKAVNCATTYGKGRIFHLLHLGNLYREAGYLEQSLTTLDKALEINPTHPRLYFSKSHTLEKLNNIEGAVLCVEKAIKFAFNKKSEQQYRQHLDHLTEPKVNSKELV